MTKREKIFAGLIGLMFFTMLGLGIVIRNINETVNNTDEIVVRVTNPKLQKAQFKSFTTVMDCTQQKNLQKLVDKLVANNLLPDIGTLIEPECMSKPTEKGSDPDGG